VIIATGGTFYTRLLIPPAQDGQKSPLILTIFRQLSLKSSVDAKICLDNLSECKDFTLLFSRQFIVPA